MSETTSMQDEFWAPRASFRALIPELEMAADLLARAANCLCAGDATKARVYLRQADMPVLRIYTRSIASQMTREIHRFRDVPGLPAMISLPERGPRQPPPAVALEIYHRDGFLCRYCGCRIVCSRAQSQMSKLLPGAVQWGASDAELNAVFFTLKGVLDHVDPHAHGGSSDPENLVVSCQPCNYGKGSYFIQQLGLSDPRLRAPKRDGWDGLRRVLEVRPAAAGTRTVARPRSISVDDFAATFSVSDRRHLDVLLEVLGSCVDLGVYWNVKAVLMAKIRYESVTLHALAVEPDTTVQIPWFIGPHKRAFRAFSKTLAAGLPNATVYETKKMWRVRVDGHLPRLSQLMQNPDAVRDAFLALHSALMSSPRDEFQ